MGGVDDFFRGVGLTQGGMKKTKPVRKPVRMPVRMPVRKPVRKPVHKPVRKPVVNKPFNRYKFLGGFFEELDEAFDNYEKEGKKKDGFATTPALPPAPAKENYAEHQDGGRKKKKAPKKLKKSKKTTGGYEEDEDFVDMDMFSQEAAQDGGMRHFARRRIVPRRSNVAPVSRSISPTSRRLTPVRRRVGTVRRRTTSL